MQAALFTHRDISWLSFNYRVLQEAKDRNVPLFERIKFLAIYSSNLDEFFRVRVAYNRSLIRLGKKTKKRLEYSPEQVMADMRKIINKQQEEYSYIFEKEIIPELARNGVNLLTRLDLNEEQKFHVENYFVDHMLPYVQPVLLVKNKIRAFLNNAALYLAVHLLTNNQKTGHSHRYAILKIPSDHLPRFVPLPSQDGQHDLIMLDDVVRHNVAQLFPGYKINDTYSFKITRDAELYIDDEFSGDLIEKIKASLSKRDVGPATRFVYDRDIPKKMLKFFRSNFSIETEESLPEGRYHNNFDFFHFPHFGMTQLRNNSLPPLKIKKIEEASSIFDLMDKKDWFFNFPFHCYDYVVRFFEEAANDPYVTHIKIIQYRVSKRSRIMDALIKAVRNGKQVTTFVEVKARFDEEANIRWAEKLEAAGVKVLYSFPGLKVHSKFAIAIRNKGSKGPKLYTYLSTGNFHEGTAKIYSDMGLLTTDDRLSKEGLRMFNYLENVKKPKNPFKHLLVGQFNLRKQLVRLIENEIEQAKKGKKAEIILKMNSLEDRRMIQKLYDASNAGVKIKLIVRGICCLIPKQKGLSENISVISIVDRFLEHSRVFIFHNEGKKKIYLSSADWMRRNLSYRIETAFPIYDQKIRKTILDIIDIQLNDNVKARILDKDMKNHYKMDEYDLPIRSQIETYYYLKRNDDL